MNTKQQTILFDCNSGLVLDYEMANLLQMTNELFLKIKRQTVERSPWTYSKLALWSMMKDLPWNVNWPIRQSPSWKISKTIGGMPTLSSNQQMEELLKMTNDVMAKIKQQAGGMSPWTPAKSA